MEPVLSKMFPATTWATRVVMATALLGSSSLTACFPVYQPPPPDRQPCLMSCAERKDACLIAATTAAAI